MSLPSEASTASPAVAALPVPAHAAGLIIGKGGASIKALQSRPGITSCTLVAAGLNAHVLHLSGSDAAVAEVLRECAFKIANADRNLANESRKIHSYSVSPTGHVFMPREVHHTGDAAPKAHTTGVGKNHYASRKKGAAFDREKNIKREARKEEERK